MQMIDPIHSLMSGYGLQFELVGTLLALAIYNGHVLELSFPMVTYKCAIWPAHSA